VKTRITSTIRIILLGRKIEDEKNVNKRRKEVGLEPLAEFDR
jgi:hypothetical protein